MKKKLVLSVMLVVMLALGLSFIGCDNGTTTDDPPPPSFVAVTSISGVPTSGVKNTVLTLTGTVNPADATNKTIAWTVKTAGTTGATITDRNKLNTMASGTVTVTATITNGLTASSNFTQDFNVSIADSFVPVTSISGVSTSGTVGTALALSGTVNPNNATNQTITWSVKSGSATISGNSLTASASGEVVVTATIVNGLTVSSNFTQDFNITFAGGGGGDFVAVSSISGVPTSGTIGNITLTGTVNPNNATNQTIVWSVKTAGTTGATINGSTLNTMSSGTVTVTASIINGLTSSSNFEQDFNISITGGGGGGIPTGLIGKWSTSQEGEELFEITAIYYLNSGSNAPGTHKITVNGNTITVYTGTTNYASGTFNFALNSSDTVLTVTERSSSGGSSSGPQNGTYYKISAQ